jgi:hypothetical protein
MNNQIGFIGKLLIFSGVLAVLIKYGGRFLPIDPSNTNALIAILFIPLVMFFLLWWRGSTSQ